MVLTFPDFWAVGREEWRAQGSLPGRLFTRLAGPLGVHARIRNAHLLRVLLALNLPQDAQLLDAGCGHAYTLFWLARRFPRYALIGVDQDARLITDNRRIADSMGLEGVTFVHSSVEDLPSLQLATACDLIVSVDVLEHVPDDVAVLRQFRRLLKPTGRLLLHLPLRHQQQVRVFPAFRHHTIPDHVRDEYTLDEAERKLADSDFGVIWRGWGFGLAGELAFELNYLAWDRRWLRNLLALLTLPLAIPLAYLDVRYPPNRGNSMLILAKPLEG